MSKRPVEANARFLGPALKSRVGAFVKVNAMRDEAGDIVKDGKGFIVFEAEFEDGYTVVVTNRSLQMLAVHRGR